MVATSDSTEIFVAGNNGQVALSLQEAAEKTGVALACAGRPAFDLADPDGMQAAIEARKPSAIINAAAYTAVDAAESDEDTATAINSAGAGALAAITAESGIPFLHLSTDYVFEGAKDEPYDETDPVGPTGAYGRSKLAGERAVIAANPNAIILRTAWVYSPFGKNFLKTMLSLAGRDALSVVADQRGNPTYAPDIADALLSIVHQLGGKEPSEAQAGLYHMTGSGDTTWHGFAGAIFEEGARYGLNKPNLSAVTTADYPTPARRPANSRLNCAKLEQNFGISLPNWRESTSACVKRLSQIDELS